MGAYLSEPLTTKDSSEEANDLLACGSSSMQGWRISQEDAHNCILSYDEKTSFFAVYDGHGGAEVAHYCSLHLPTFLKKLQSYKAKDFEQALKDAFIGFDASLLNEKVIDELKRLSDKTNGEEAIEDDDEEEEDDNVDDLCKEACMPLNEVLQMYKKDKKNPALSKIKEGNSSKPASPFLKGKRKGLAEGDEPGPSSSNAGASTAGPSKSAEADSKKPGSADAADSTVSSSSNKTEEAAQKPESSSSATKKNVDQSDEISESDGIAAIKAKAEECAPDSSSAPVANGDVGDSANKSAVSSSVSAQENGEVSSNSARESSTNKNMPDLAESSSGSKSAASVDSSSAGSSSSAAPVGAKKRSVKNGVPNLAVYDSDDDDTETDDEFPPVQDSNETSSTEDGEEDAFGEEVSEEEEDEEGEGEYDEEEEDYMNEEDEAFMNNITDEPGKDSGCTAVVALLHDKELFVANAGDSRCVVCRKGKALEMSIDHKPEDQVEFDRIQKAGGRVTLDGRVNGGLNLSRAIGDHGYKMNKKLPPEEQMISALPDIKKITICPDDEFMVLACDGIWNFMTSDDVVEFVQDRIADPTKKLSDICEEMFDYCLAPHTKGDGTGCDNMTAIIVQFKPNLAGAASRKRACSPEPETTGTESDCKKPKTESNASSTTVGSNGSTSSSSNCETTTKGTASNNDEKEAAAAVASIESSSAMDAGDDNMASSST
ncbi:probable protein phosphatase CG10417 [Ochlerotatus camptorhynchus]|uniref:probable protein phosphatase CG10417 n=1 Tax=Ochlerotatus camptorhynchus TaxID=644619 RepID=UPI0031E3833A